MSYTSFVVCSDRDCCFLWAYSVQWLPCLFIYFFQIWWETIVTLCISLTSSTQIQHVWTSVKFTLALISQMEWMNKDHKTLSKSTWDCLSFHVLTEVACVKQFFFYFSPSIAKKKSFHRHTKLCSHSSIHLNVTGLVEEQKCFCKTRWVLFPISPTIISTQQRVKWSLPPGPRGAHLLAWVGAVWIALM